MLLCDPASVDSSLTLLANRRELRVSPKLSGSGEMFTNIRLRRQKNPKKNNSSETQPVSVNWEVTSYSAVKVTMRNSRFAVSPQTALQKVGKFGVPVWNMALLENKTHWCWKKRKSNQDASTASNRIKDTVHVSISCRASTQSIWWVSGAPGDPPCWPVRWWRCPGWTESCWWPSSLWSAHPETDSSPFAHCQPSPPGREKLRTREDEEEEEKQKRMRSKMK